MSSKAKVCSGYVGIADCERSNLEALKLSLREKTFLHNASLTAAGESALNFVERPKGEQ
jgi:hypothetical protein